MLRQPLSTELAAAIRTASKAGLGTVTPEVLHLGNHTTVRLRPWPVVARIASGTSFDFSDGSMERELGIGAHLISRAAPSARPATFVDPGPYIHGDCAISLWNFVDGRPVSSEADVRMAATSLHAVHSALSDVDADLPSFITKVESCEAILANPDQAQKLSAGDRLFLEKLYERLHGELRAIGGRWHPLHGDSHIGNVRVTGAGAIWLDLESVCMGPTEWDVATLPEPIWCQFPGLNPDLMRLFADVRGLCVAVWCWAEFGRSAATNEAAIYHLAKLKNQFS